MVATLARRRPVEHNAGGHEAGQEIDVTPNEIPEAWLQTWFEYAVQQPGGISATITNREELARQLLQLTKANQRTQDIQRRGLDRAKDICQLMDDADLFSANRSVSLDGGVQMRPDLILFTQSAHYLLVELKTRAAAERQGVQELLAYSTAMKLRYPYVNDFIYVVVAGAWEPLLARSVQALIMDGKRVLPLQWSLHDLHGPMPLEDPAASRPAAPRRQFSLDIRLDLFDLNFVQNYDPMLAIMTETVGVARHARHAVGVGNYFYGVAHRAAADCRQIRQSGFAIVWGYPGDAPREEILNVTLATVNQHWVQSPQTPRDYFNLPDAELGIAKLARRQADDTRKSLTEDAAPDDFFAQCAANGAAAEYFPQSSLSYELLNRHRDYDVETRLQQVWKNVGDFDPGGELNLKKFMCKLEQVPQPVTVWAVVVFGEVEDYFAAEDCSSTPDVRELRGLFECFRIHKGYGTARPGDE